MTATKDAFFNPAKLTSQEKAAQTNQTARRIIDEETAAREKKTERLRLARMEQRDAEAVVTPVKKKAKK
jgi:hypothetical protein